VDVASRKVEVREELKAVVVVRDQSDDGSGVEADDNG
jgi:hypothetical protein